MFLYSLILSLSTGCQSPFLRLPYRFLCMGWVSNGCYQRKMIPSSFYLKKKHNNLFVNPWSQLPLLFSPLQVSSFYRFYPGLLYFSSCTSLSTLSQYLLRQLFSTFWRITGETIRSHCTTLPWLPIWRLLLIAFVTTPWHQIHLSVNKLHMIMTRLVKMTTVNWS